MVYILTQGGPGNATQILPVLAYQIGIQAGNLGRGAAIALFLVPLLAPAMFICPEEPEAPGVLGSWPSPGPPGRRRPAVPAHLRRDHAVRPDRGVSHLLDAITAFKQDPDLYRMDNIPFWFNLPPTLKHFKTLFYQTNYGSWIVNTMTISVWVALITLLTAVPAGYALARLRLPGAENTGIAIFMTYLVPPIILFLPLSRVVASLGLQDSWWALVVVYPTFTIPFCTWLMMGFFKTVPMEMEEAARVDGCG